MQAFQTRTRFMMWWTFWRNRASNPSPRGTSAERARTSTCWNNLTYTRLAKDPISGIIQSRFNRSNMWTCHSFLCNRRTLSGNFHYLDDSSSRGWWRWVVATTGRPQGPASRKRRRHTRKTGPRTQTQPKTFSAERQRPCVCTRLPLSQPQPQLPTFQRPTDWGCHWEVREPSRRLVKGRF